MINGKPNARGGIFLASGHCARQYIELGEMTGATPDGRRKGDEISKNLSPTMGADTEGATALVQTLAASSATILPGDYPLDMMLHPSVCIGDKGLKYAAGTSDGMTFRARSRMHTSAALKMS